MGQRKSTPGLLQVSRAERRAAPGLPLGRGRLKTLSHTDAERRIHIFSEAGDQGETRAAVKSERFLLTFTGLQHQTMNVELTCRLLDGMEQRGSDSAPSGSGAHEHPFDFTDAFFDAADGATPDRVVSKICDQKRAVALRHFARVEAEVSRSGLRITF